MFQMRFKAVELMPSVELNLNMFARTHGESCAQCLQR